MPRPARLVTALLCATLAAAGARAQDSPPLGGGASSFGFGEAPRSGPGPRGQSSIGGTISGRMNLIAPADVSTVAPQLSAPPVAPAPILSPERFDSFNPAAIGSINLDGVAPAAPRAAPKPVPRPDAAPLEAALTPPDAAPAQIAPIKQRLSLAATFSPGGARIPSGVKWRLFTDQADANGEHLLVAESSDAAPRFEVDPGSYIVHAVYGLVSAAKFVQVTAGHPTDQGVVLAAGAVRISAFIGRKEAPADAIALKLTREIDGVTRTVAEGVKSGAMLRLPAGRYHITSLYGDANSTVEADLDVAPGKFVEAQVHHKAAKISLKLVQQAGGTELGDTSWTVLTPGGDVIRDSIGALDDLVLAEGDYTAIARRDGQLYQQSFEVKAGADTKVEVVAR